MTILDRRRQLADSLRSGAGDAAPEGRSRLVWLLTHLEEYVDRWIGFSDIESVTMPSLINSDIHQMVLAAIDVIEEEVHRYVFEMPSGWVQLKETVRKIDGYSSKNIVHRLPGILAGIRKAVDETTSD